jgi:hypothetical protein
MRTAVKYLVIRHLQDSGPLKTGSVGGKSFLPTRSEARSWDRSRSAESRAGGLSGPEAKGSGS